MGAYGDVCRDVLKLKPLRPLAKRADLEKRFLNAHNDIRRLYGLPLFTWDENLATYAQAWADHLKQNDGCNIRHRSKDDGTKKKSYGENLAWNWISPKMSGPFQESPEFAVFGWAHECADYNFDDNSCRPEKKCGHFTQLLWKKSLRVGCAVVTCEGRETYKGYGLAEAWVCNYDPAGNVVVDTGHGFIEQRPF